MTTPPRDFMRRHRLGRSVSMVNNARTPEAVHEAISAGMGLGAVALAVALVFAPSGVANADDAAGPMLDLGARRALLGEWIDAQAAQQRKERRFTGGSVLAVSAAGLGYGLTLVIKPPNNELSKGGGVALTAAGALGAALGIFRLVAESESEQVARRYAEATPADEAGIARFEGELYSASQHAHRVQRVARWLGFATAVVGVGVLVATPFVGLSEGGRVASYVAGSLLFVGGGVNFASSFGTPPPIKAWESYRQGRGPTPTSTKLFGFAPMLGPGSAGVVISVQPHRY